LSDSQSAAVLLTVAICPRVAISGNDATPQHTLGMPDKSVVPSTACSP
jgi:hypothetical protein